MAGCPHTRRHDADHGTPAHQRGSAHPRGSPRNLQQAGRHASSGSGEKRQQRREVLGLFTDGGEVAHACGDVLLKVRLALVAIRSEEYTSELQSQSNLVCRLLLEKKKKKK